MGKTIITLLVYLFGLTIYAQKVKEKDIIGTWELIMNVEEAIKQEADESDTMMEEIFIKTLSGFVGNIIDEIDIYLKFKKKNKLEITINAFDGSEIKYGSWSINDKGYLLIEGFDGHDELKIDATAEEWKLVDSILVTDEHEENRNVYMTKID